MPAGLDGELAAAEAGVGRGQLRVEPGVCQPRGRDLRPPGAGRLLPHHLQEEGGQDEGQEEVYEAQYGGKHRDESRYIEQVTYFSRSWIYFKGFMTRFSYLNVKKQQKIK